MSSTGEWRGGAASFGKPGQAFQTSCLRVCVGLMCLLPFVHETSFKLSGRGRVVNLCAVTLADIFGITSVSVKCKIQ